VQPRLDRNLLQKVEVECAGNLPKPLDLQEAIEDGLRLWLRARAQSRVDSQNSQTPTGFSGSGGLENIDLTTTTTTVGSQPHKARLPGVASAIAEFRNQPHQSRHDIELNLAYAWESNRKGEGINAPDVWAASNFRTGKHDALIDLWLDRKRSEEEVRTRRAAAAVAREESARQEAERVRQQLGAMEEERARIEDAQLAVREAEEVERQAEKEKRARELAELDERFDEGLAQGKKPWQIT
jgi:DNA repair exonuclease SbcCD ATPase subunit